ncbi:MAG: DUF4160 domain-containing protein [Bdellovibrionaceae bacterium]|nr:DUF4160 domain-containing protein [Pseudobdellovibrionaceae bacterium]
MSPTVFTYKKYRFYFFSREELRPHIHVTCPDGEAKFWIEPTVALANFVGLSKKQLTDLHKLVEEHQNEIAKKWQKHFGS